MKNSILPSGQQIEISYGNQHATVVEVGGGIREYTVGSRSVLDGYGSDEMCSGARGQVLIPWPNRIEDGQYNFEGQQFQLDLSEPARHNAIHGLVRFEHWHIREQAQNRILLEHLLYPKPGYPFTLELQTEYRLSELGLEVKTSAKNVGEYPAPFGMGAHPYLTIGTPRIDSAMLQLSAERWLPTDERGIPIHGESRSVEGTPYDFRKAHQIGETQIDYAFTGLIRDQEGKAHVTLKDPNTSQSVTLWVDSSFPFLEIFTGEDLPDVERRRHSLGVEPMTCAPNSFRNKEGLIRLNPNESWTGTWGVSYAA